MSFWHNWQYDPESPRIVDLCSGAGGAAKGLTNRWPRARIVGVDLVRQPNYPFNHVRGDALEFDLTPFDFVWASPPCQAWSVASVRWQNLGRTYPDILEPMRAKLQASGLPYIIENVATAPLIDPVMLCGTMFPPLRVYRHRGFEANFHIDQPDHPQHTIKIGWGPQDFVTVAGHSGYKSPGTPAARRRAMGIQWMSYDELCEAVPPAYSAYLANYIPFGASAGATEVE